MAIATEDNAALFTNIVADTPLNNNYPLYAEDEVEVVYGSQALVATLNVDYTVELSEPNYNSFTVTPLATLKAKIDALIATPPTSETETNFVVVRRKLTFLTSATPEGVRSTNFLSKEIDRIHMKLLQQQERLNRSLAIPANTVGEIGDEYTISSPVEGFAPVWRGDKLVAEIDATNIAAAEVWATAAFGYRNETEVYADAAEAYSVYIANLVALIPLNNYLSATNPTVDNDVTEGYSTGSEWINTSTGDKFSCTDATEGAAIWTQVDADLSTLGNMAYETKTDYVLQTEVPSIRAIPQNSKSTDYTAVLGDAGGHILHPGTDGTARQFTIPANSSVAFPIGTAITFVNQHAAGNISIAITTDTMRLAGDGTTGTRLLKPNGVATALKITATEWIISGTNLE